MYFLAAYAFISFFYDDFIAYIFLLFYDITTFSITIISLCYFRYIDIIVFRY